MIRYVVALMGAVLILGGGLWRYDVSHVSHEEVIQFVDEGDLEGLSAALKRGSPTGEIKDALEQSGVELRKFAEDTTGLVRVLAGLAVPDTGLRTRSIADPDAMALLAKCGSVDDSGDPERFLIPAAASLFMPSKISILLTVHLMVSDSSGLKSLLVEQENILNKGFEQTGITFQIDEILHHPDQSAWHSIKYEQVVGQDTVFKPVPHTDMMLRSLSRYPGQRINIFIGESVYSINDAGVSRLLAGRAIFPWSNDPQTHHAVFLYRRALPCLHAGQTCQSVENYDRGHVLLHEMGHYFGLFHTFQNGCKQPGDKITDTPYHRLGGRQCALDHADLCSPRPEGEWYNPINNFMSEKLDDCTQNFSAEQMRTMKAAIFKWRSSLVRPV